MSTSTRSSQSAQAKRANCRSQLNQPPAKRKNGNRKPNQNNNKLVTPTPDKEKVKKIIQQMPKTKLVTEMRQVAKGFTDRVKKSLSNPTRKHICTEPVYKSVWNALFPNKYKPKKFDINKDYYWQKTTIKNYSDSEDIYTDVEK